MKTRRSAEESNPDEIELQRENFQSGSPVPSSDLEGLSSEADADSESVSELVDEGQYEEAYAIDAIENAPNADVSEVRTRQFLVDDVALEYLETDD